MFFEENDQIVFEQELPESHFVKKVLYLNISDQLRARNRMGAYKDTESGVSGGLG